MPILINADSPLENLVFEVVNTDGEVDKGIHSEAHNGQRHTLQIRSDSLDLDDPPEYCFYFGRCTVQEIPIPRKEGKFCFKATYSHHPGLSLNVEVHILKQLRTEHENIPCQISDEKILSCASYGNPDQSADKGLLLLSDSSEPLAVCDQPEMTHKNVPSQRSEGKYSLSSEPSKEDHHVNGPHKYAERSVFLLPDSSTPSHVGNSTKCAMIDHTEFEDELLRCGLCIKEHEMNIESLKFQQSKIKQEISTLEDCVDGHDLDCTYEKQLVMKRIVSQRGSAAAVICQLFQSSTWGEMKYDFAKNIIGVVAFLGLVQTDDLSRVLAEYLGEHQMLGIVCKSYAEASHLEMHESDGSVNNAHGLHALAAERGMSINKQYLVFCLENIRPYRGKVCSDAQRKLQLPDPILPNGKPPPGFLGYAVNMIDIDVPLREWRTASGLGLRETLFYRLFGELQVYKNRQCMMGAESCTRDGAVSLDGGIKRGNGVLSLGYWDEDIRFPVVPNPLKMYETKQEQLRETNDELMREQSRHVEDLKKFRKLEYRLNSLMDEIERSMGGCLVRKFETESS